ncbi:hypothetical protein [Enterobacter phage 03_vB_Eclo_IJM]|nr:hypothetical protein [Enterobacter phage 03_vB_Eclo_IJM]
MATGYCRYRDAFGSKQTQFASTGSGGTGADIVGILLPGSLRTLQSVPLV